MANVRKSVSKASVPPASSKRKGPKPVDINIVNFYVNRLLAALGDPDTFAVVYAEMETDRLVRQAEAVGIAKSFYGDASSKHSKSEAFRRIRLRQNALMDSRAKSRAQAGKSAA